ncbi:MAG: hypothetical protein HQK79_21935 [Desulfobacterales bacterium]|nr:hypothetical protein [Desulfobacterales bacterium]
MIRIVAKSFDNKLLKKVVFLGGSVVSFLLTDKDAPPVRATNDVDVIVGIEKLTDYYKLGDHLKKLSFTQSIDNANICRWKINGIIVDIMPVSENVLGFSNKWYKPALKKATPFKIDEELQINLISSVYFIATKLEAFNARGNDYQLSNDLEDIIYVINSRPELITEIKNSNNKLKQYFRSNFKNFMKNADVLEAIKGFFKPDTESQKRYNLIITRLNDIIEIPLFPKKIVVLKNNLKFNI